VEGVRGTNKVVRGIRGTRKLRNISLSFRESIVNKRRTNIESRLVSSQYECRVTQTTTSGREWLLCYLTAQFQVHMWKEIARGSKR
jgi:hypothetical protein